MKKIVFIGIIILIMMSISGHSETMNNSGIKLSANDIIQDLESLKIILKGIHPKVKNNIELSVEIEQKIEQKIEEHNDTLHLVEFADFYFELLEIFSVIGDAHSVPNYYKSDEEIPLSIAWTVDGLIINKDYNYNNKIEKGDKISSIGNTNPNEILDKMRNLIPSENKYFTQFIMEEFIFQKDFLNRFNLINPFGDVEIQIEKSNGKKERVTLHFYNRKQVYNSKQENNQQNPYYYDINLDKGLAIFYLNKSIINDDVKITIRNFFNDVKSYNINKIAIDLRQNTGGNSLVIDEFLSYIPTNRVKWFTEENYFKQRGVLEINKNSIENQQLYKGEIYLLISKRTFSAANWFAGIFKYNKIGIVVGEPTGNKPTSYGEVKYFRLPKTRIPFQVSTKSYITFIPGFYNEGGFMSNAL